MPFWKEYSLIKYLSQSLFTFEVVENAAFWSYLKSFDVIFNT